MLQKHIVHCLEYDRTVHNFRISHCIFSIRISKIRLVNQRAKKFKLSGIIFENTQTMKYLIWKSNRIRSIFYLHIPETIYQFSHCFESFKTITKKIEWCMGTSSFSFH